MYDVLYIFIYCRSSNVSRYLLHQYTHFTSIHVSASVPNELPLSSLLSLRTCLCALVKSTCFLREVDLAWPSARTWATCGAYATCTNSASTLDRFLMQAVACRVHPYPSPTPGSRASSSQVLESCNQRVAQDEEFSNTPLACCRPGRYHGRSPSHRSDEATTVPWTRRGSCRVLI